MSELIFTFDRQTQEFNCIQKDISSYYCDLTAGLLTNGETIEFNNLSFGFTILHGEEIILEKSYPPTGIIYLRSDQDKLVTERVNWKPDWELDIEVWVETFGQKFISNVQLTVPRPIQPYPSWSWDGNNWISPVPYPDDDNNYTWDDDIGNWILVVEE